MRILTIVGARPQFIKAAALSREFLKYDEIQEFILHTGQHFDSNMSDVFFEEMQIPKPHFQLNINSLGHGAMTGRMLEGIEKIILDNAIDLVLVYGDTNSTIAGALAAKKLHVRVAHVEAGLRSYNMNMPEEINRILTDRISDYLFCPTITAYNNLIKEGYDNIACHVAVTGDVMKDAALFYSELSAERSSIIKKLDIDNFILCTLHRQENTASKSRMSSIVEAINELSKEQEIVLPLHPSAKKKLIEYGLTLNATVIDPVGYFDMIELLKHCNLVMTDSGGLQKEACFFNKYCITMRDETEWVELVENKVNTIVGADKEKIMEAVQEYTGLAYKLDVPLYGEGDACASITKILLQG